MMNKEAVFLSMRQYGKMYESEGNKSSLAREQTAGWNDS